MADNYTTLLPVTNTVDELLGNKDGQTVRIARGNITNGASPADVIAVANRATALEANVPSGSLLMQRGANIASASTVNLGAATGDFVDITGTTAITALGTMAAGIERVLRFVGVLTLTHNATSLILPTGANILTEAGDIAVFRSLGSGNWRCIIYHRASGQALAGVSESRMVATELGVASVKAVIRFVPGPLTYIADSAGNYVAAFDAGGLGAGSVGASTMKADVPPYVRRNLNTGTGGVVYSKTVSAKQQVHLVTGSGETQISDGTANDIAPVLMGDIVRFASDRDGGSNRAFRMFPTGKSVLSERGSPTVYLHILYGQSLTRGQPPVITSAASALGAVLMFNGGTRANGASATTSTVQDPTLIDRLIPLVASGVETFGEGLAYKAFSASSLRGIVASMGIGGQAYYYLKKGTQPYANVLAVVQRAYDLVRALGYQLEAVVHWQHGEADYPETRANYKSYLASLATTSLAVDIKAITGQSTVHIFAGQSPSLSQSQVPLALFEAAKEISNLHLIGPLYDLSFVDTQHPNGRGNFLLGEMYARAVNIVLAGGTWKPFQPLSATLSGSTITVTMEGYTGTPQIDTTGVSNIGTGKGFEYFDDASPPAITDVTATSTGYTVTLASAPTGSAGSRKLRTGYTAPSAVSSPQGSILGARTNLCDQDTLVSSYDATALPKRCVIAEIAVT